VFKKCSFFCSLIFIINLSIPAQTHISVPLDNPIYIMIEQAQIRGLCGFLPSTKPYSRAMILSIIDEILESDPAHLFAKLKDSERETLEKFRKDFFPDRNNLDLMRGIASKEHTWNDSYFSVEFNFGIDLAFGSSFYPIAGGFTSTEVLKSKVGNDKPKTIEVAHPASGDFFMDYSFMPYISLLGDLGKYASYGFALGGFLGKSPRAILGQYETTPYDEEDKKTYYQSFPTRSEPLAYFPYTYKKRWDGFVWATTQVDNTGQLNWPESVSIGYLMLPELSGSFLNGHFMYRIARVDREWGGPINNGSLLLNQSAQPFLAFETVIMPFDWITFSSLTGVLEYNNSIGSDNSAKIEDASESFQNAFSIVMLDFNFKKYFKISFGSSVVWPKRFELGYPFPLMENFLYQNDIGDFDNLALFLNLEGHTANLGKIWFSLFIDEMNPESNFFKKDRMMYAYQAGGSFYFPWLPFASVTLSYTKVEPYNYTHSRGNAPWYTSEILMETNYVNFGKSLGYYLPPNSDEILFSIQTIPDQHSLIRLQYQLIRHGADYGDRAVDGSSYWSELKKIDRSSMMKYFLQDGAYQWMNVFKIRGEYSFTGKKVPVRLIGEIGGVYSYFTDTDGELGTSGDYSIINTPEYPHSLSFIVFIGVRIFPKY